MRVTPLTFSRLVKNPGYLVEALQAATFLVYDDRSDNRLFRAATIFAKRFQRGKKRPVLEPVFRHQFAIAGYRVISSQAY